MKIALLTDGITPYVIGGMQKHSFYLCKFFALKGIDVDLYHTSKDLNGEIRKLSIFTEKEKQHINSILVEFPQTDSLFGHYVRNSKEYSQNIYEYFLKRPKVDFIYAKGLTSWVFLKKKEKGQKLPPIGVNIHGYEMYQIAPSFKVKLEHCMLRPTFKVINQKADFIFSYGGKISSIITEKLLVPIHRIIEIPTGIGSDWIEEDKKVANEIRHFVFLGRYERRKGVEELTVVLKELLNKYDFRFEFIGPIPESKKINSSKIIYHDLIHDKEEIKKVLRRVDILVCPSHSEGMPNVIMEGMATQNAIIATNVGAIKEQMSSENGWLIEPNNKKELKEAIESALKISSAELEEKQQNSLSLIKNQFLWDIIIDKTIQRIKTIIEDNSPCNF